MLETSPKWPLANFNLGLLHEEQGRLEDARTAYAREVETYPGEFKARFNLGKVLFKLGDRAGSLGGDARGRQAHAEAGRGASLPGPGPSLRRRPPRRGQGRSRPGPGPGRDLRAQGHGPFPAGRHLQPHRGNG
ncbi:MAG: tetratricopeptide repeat protein [Candidatus Moduliflexus flocculans]|nr:tetratricopeptide repeat protein [Candidatus Moduliflexus flocculans]